MNPAEATELTELQTQLATLQSLVDALDEELTNARTTLGKIYLWSQHTSHHEAALTVQHLMNMDP